jgi:hypothetical protein
MKSFKGYSGTILPLTNHARVRMGQRGYRGFDVELVLRYGTEGLEAVVLTHADVARGVRRLKQEIQALERLNGTTIVTDGEVVQTVYRPSKRRMAKFLNGTRRRARQSQEAR